MDSATRERRIEELVGDCEAYWVVRGVPRETTDEMKGELRDHLVEAHRDGKNLDDVIGGDVVAFAEAWAEPNRPPVPLRKRVLDWTFPLLIGVTAMLATKHIVPPSPSFSVGWGTLAAAVLIVAALAVILHPPFFGEVFVKSGWKSLLLRGLIGAATFAALVVVFALERLIAAPSLFEWHWVATAVLAVITVCLTAYQIKHDPTRRR